MGLPGKGKRIRVVREPEETPEPIWTEPVKTPEEAPAEPVRVGV